MSHQDSEETSFLRTDDYICLSCMGHGHDGQGDRYCLAGGGFGNRMCFIENISYATTSPPDLSLCYFVLEQALSVRALQEMVSANYETNAGAQSGHRTLLYGHAVLLRHEMSNMYLSCLSSSSTSDKLAFDVGLQESSKTEACWWTIHPASKQRSDGEKVRIGDDLILVSVSSERYLNFSVDMTSQQANIIASFQQTLWCVLPVSSGFARQKSLGMVLGSDILRLYHGDECLAVPSAEGDSAFSGSVMYEIGAVCCHARSLWRIEHIKTKWSGGFFTWGSQCRLRHVTSGRYLGVQPNQNDIVTLHSSKADFDSSAFYIWQSKDDKKKREEREEEGMGQADLKFGESVAFFQHCSSGRWMSYETYETKKRGVGRVEEKKVVLLAEGHMDDGVTFARAQDEESRSAVAIRRSAYVFTRFMNGLDSFIQEGPRSNGWLRIKLDDVFKCLEDLIEFFVQPKPDEVHEEKQAKLKALRNRQDLFQEEGVISLVLGSIDKFTSAFSTRRDFVQAVGEDHGELFDQLSNYLYLLLAAMIRGNRDNCAQFAHAARLDWLFHRLELQQSAEGVLDTLHCVLTDSHQALNMITERHIRTLIGLLDKQGRDPRVLQVLCSLCVGRQGGAVRLNQNLIYDSLLPERDLLLQTHLVDQYGTMRPNLFVGYKEGCATFKRWYYELVIDNMESVSSNDPQLRVGWANTDGFCPYPGGGYFLGAHSVGDDLYSVGFDGCSIWCSGKAKRVRIPQMSSTNRFFLQRGDVIGCMLDFTIPCVKFSLNGNLVRGLVQDFFVSGLYFPCVSISAKVSARFVFGGNQGRLKYGPPESYSSMSEALQPRERLRIEPCFQFGLLEKSILCGPSPLRDGDVFIPEPVDTQKVQLPAYAENVRDKLAENIHDMWAMRKIEQGWVFGERRDDQKKTHPCLTSFEKLPASERQYDVTLAYETLRTIAALGYTITYEQPPDGSRMKTLKLPNSFLQSNGYRPQPLDLSSHQLNDNLERLVDQLAENTHNVWARDRIRQGWTFGCVENIANKRSPHLVPYSSVEDHIKRSNRATATQTIKTMLIYGYNIETAASDQEDRGAELSAPKVSVRYPTRTYRGENTWAVLSGRWYYEVELLTIGPIRLGWATVVASPEVDIGSDENSYAFDCSEAVKWHGECISYGKICQVGDVIGCMLDLQDHTITFSLNGELMMDPLGQEIAYKHINVDHAGFVPAFTLGASQQMKINFGNDVNTLKFFSYCGLQEGFQPFCVNMCRSLPLWYSRGDPSLFENVEADHPRLKVVTTYGSSPSLKIISKTFGQSQKDEMEFIRLSLPVKCKEQFYPRTVQERHRQLDELRRQFDREMYGGMGPMVGLSQGMPNAGLSNGDMAGSLMDIGGSGQIDKRAKRGGMRIGNPFKRSRPRDASPSDIVSGTNIRGAINTKHGRGVLSPSTSMQEAAQPPAAVPPRGPPPSLPTGRAALEDTDYTQVENIARENSIAEFIDEYFYSVVVLPGQDPAHVYVGWVTSNFRLPLAASSGSGASVKMENMIDQACQQQALLVQLDQDYGLKSSINERACYMVNVGDIVSKFATQEDLGKRMSQGISIGCWMDACSGTLGFELNGRDTSLRYEVEPNTRLFASMFVKATSREVAQFDLDRTRYALPLAACMLRPPKMAHPQLPPRLKIQALETTYWSRVPNAENRVNRLKMSDVRGWSMLCENPVQSLSVYVPEADRSFDVLELQEKPSLLKFHSNTLELLRAVCYHGNHNVALNLTSHVDEKQLLFAISNPYINGSLRIGFFDLLLAMHLDSHTKLKLATQNEFVVPLSSHIVNDPTCGLMDVVQEFHHVPAVNQHLSIRPDLCREENMFKYCDTSDTNSRLADCPPFPRRQLKEMCLQALVDCVNKGKYIRDPIGGTKETMFVPLLRVLDSLLVMGELDHEDMKQLKAILNPKVFDISSNVSLMKVNESLLEMPLPENVQLELCKLLHHLCDLQLRHRVELIVAFSNFYVSETQDDQLRRYMDIKLSNLPSSVTARLTKEFRCPPIDQMRYLLSFKPQNETDEDESSPEIVNSDLRDSLTDFHHKLSAHCGVVSSSEEANQDPNATAEAFTSKKSEFFPENIGDPEAGGKPPRFLTAIWEAITGRGASAIDNAEEGPLDNLDLGNLSTVICQTIISWSSSNFIENLELIRQMFSLIYRQYNSLGEVLSALEKTYVISQVSKEDVTQMLRSLGRVRCLLGVQVGPSEEHLLKSCLWDIMNNKVFFQHPNLSRCLALHETVMQLMVHTLNRASTSSLEATASAGNVMPGGGVGGIPGIGPPGQGGPPSDIMSTDGVNGPTNTMNVSNPPLAAVIEEHPASGSKEKKSQQEDPAEMVVQCCRFLCYFCRTSRENQKAMFQHLSYMLENSSMLLSRPSLRGTAPLDVAYSSLMDNNELALALRENQLERVATYLSRCGVQSNAELLAKGYPDIGWDPIEGERFLDFLRFTVWVNGESVEENANLVVRLLIRRPECLGPALRGGQESSGGGLLKAMREAIVMSAQIKLTKLQQAEAEGQEDVDTTLPLILADYEDANLFAELPYNFTSLPSDEDEDYIDLGGAILTFYSVLVDLLGRCAPDPESSRSDSIRIRAILRSLVSMADLEGVLSLRFILPAPRMELVLVEEQDTGNQTEEWKDRSGLPPGLLPEHKAALVLFLERVYGIEDANVFTNLLENACLPDMRAATVLDSAASSDSDMALALNRYLCGSVLPLLTKYAHFLSDPMTTPSGFSSGGDTSGGSAGGVSARDALLEATLHTAYRLSKCRSLTKGQLRCVSEFLVALTYQLKPPMMTKLLHKLVEDVPSLSPESIVPLRLLTVFYRRCGRYYGSTGMVGHGIATEEERQLTSLLFTRIFDSLSGRPYDPELFSQALPCLSAIGCALPPDYTSDALPGTFASKTDRDPSMQLGGSSTSADPRLITAEDGTTTQIAAHESPAPTGGVGVFQPRPVDTQGIKLPALLANVVDQFAQHFHDSWALELMEQGWTYGVTLDERRKFHPNLVHFSSLGHTDQLKYIEPVIDSLKTMLAWGWSIESDETKTDNPDKPTGRRRPTDQHGYVPHPKDLRGVNMTRELVEFAEKLAENLHNIWAKKKQKDLEKIGGGVHHQLVPYDILTSKEKARYRKVSNELLKYLPFHGYRIAQSGGASGGRKAQSQSQSRHSSVRQGRSYEGTSAHQNSVTSRFAYSLLTKLLEYVERAIATVHQCKPSKRFSRNTGYLQASSDMKFFGKVVLPLVEKFFDAHQSYFVGARSTASIEEKKMTATLFCKLFSLLRQKMNAFGHDVNISVRCLQGLVQTIDVKAIAKLGGGAAGGEDFVRVRLLPLFTNCADDLALFVSNLNQSRYSHLKGTIQRGATSVNCIHMILLPVLKAMFEHLSKTESGADLIIGDVQVACYKILNALYILGTKTGQYGGRRHLSGEFDRHRPLLGECVAALASTFPVAFLEPEFNKLNKCSVLYGREEYHSLEAREVMQELEQNIPRLPQIIEEIAGLAESGGNYAEAPHVIEVTLPMLCSYLPAWWLHGPDNVSVSTDNVNFSQLGEATTSPMSSHLKNGLLKSPTEQHETGTTTAPSTSLTVAAGSGVSVATTNVTATLMNAVLGNVLKLIGNNVDSENAPWMTRIATRTQPIVVNATAEMLRDHFLPVAEKLKVHALRVEQEEEAYLTEKRHGNEDIGELEEKLKAQFETLVRNMFAFYPLLIKYVDLHRTSWLKNPTAQTEQLFHAVAQVFLVWAKSTYFKREEQNFVCQNEIDHLSLIMPGKKGMDQSASSNVRSSTSGGDAEAGGKGGRKQKLENYTSLNVACIKRLLPIGLSVFGGREQELVQQAKMKLIEDCVSRDERFWLEFSMQKEDDTDIGEFLKSAMEKCDENIQGDLQWQKQLYRKIGSNRFENLEVEGGQESIIHRVVMLARVLHGLHLVDHPPSSLKSGWKKLISSQRKRAVMACFRMVPLHAMPRHRVINIFLSCYCNLWLSKEEAADAKLIEDLTAASPATLALPAPSSAASVSEDHEGGETAPVVETIPDSLNQLIQAFSRSAMDQASDDEIYISYASIMGRSCSGEDEDDDDGDGGEEEDTGTSLKEQEMAKQQLLFEQGRLLDRGAAEMVMMQISAGKGEVTPVVKQTLELGIAMLLGGNVAVQSRMLQHLKDKRDVGFFTSMSGLMQQCSVLDLDTFERCNKAEAMGVSLSDMGDIVNLHDAQFTCKIFRFLQLLCEGHNLAFQDYLRAQTGSTSSVNIIICTVDYLLRLQESIMDFYWHYSGRDTIDVSGKRNFVKAIQIGKQVFRTLTEYIQGPCVENQLALAHSRLWDAIGGFLYIFAHMQDKLSKDPDQLELLREFMNLQKEMLIMLLSMLEGNVVNGPIGKQMVDTLVESSANVEMILKFFDIFLRMKDLTASETFLAFDVNGDGWISHKEFRAAMESQKMYSDEEIEYIMMCVDSNQDGKVDFNEFTDRFHSPAKDIGFNLALLLTNLYEHMPNDPRLERLVSKAKRVLDTFDPYLGRIEITGQSGRIERVYFEIRQSHIDQWEKPQIKESKRTFLHNVLNEGGDKEKLDSFVNFCEESIFEMQHAQAISGEGEGLKLSQVKAVRRILDAEYLRMIKRSFTSVGRLMRTLTFSNVRKLLSRITSLTPRQVFVGTFRLQFNLIFTIFSALYFILCTFIRVLKAMMAGPTGPERLELHQALQAQQSWLLPAEEQLALERLDPNELCMLDESRHSHSHLHSHSHAHAHSHSHLPPPPGTDANVDVNGRPTRSLSLTYKETETTNASTMDSKTSSSSTTATTATATATATTATTSSSSSSHAGNATSATTSCTTPVNKGRSSSISAAVDHHNKTAGGAAAGHGEGEVEGEGEIEDFSDEPPPMGLKAIDTSTYIISLFAKNFYKFKIAGLALAFFINFMLLFFRVVQSTEGKENGEGEEDESSISDVVKETVSNILENAATVLMNATQAAAGGGDDDAGGDLDDIEPEEFIVMSDSMGYMSQLIRLLAFLHSLMAFSSLVAYYCLKVPLVIFQREKEISRMLEFDGMWISEQPSDDNIRGHWDKLVLSAPSFPHMYWDKFVKKKVRTKYSEQYEADEITKLLGMQDEPEAPGPPSEIASPKEPRKGYLPAFIRDLDLQYQVWKWGVIFTDNSFLYLVGYFVTSVIGNYNYFFFACHLLDVAIGFKTLRTILQSVTHNGKQLVLTVMLTCVIIYLYTVIAFNFFRKFYIQEGDEGEKDMKCHDMLTCFVFHLHTGLRAGGGIGDEIESPDGDEYEVYRILFDITFFFFVIVILLAIIQGLIIDAFGELRDQLEQVKEDLESKCFICGMGKEYFDKMPHGFELHVEKEHNFANYMFFLMHLLNKPDTEYTGQETYVWELYQQRNWDFFPVGDCFRKQYEAELSGG